MTDTSSYSVTTGGGHTKEVLMGILKRDLLGMTVSVLQTVGY